MVEISPAAPQKQEKANKGLHPCTIYFLGLLEILKLIS